MKTFKAETGVILLGFGANVLAWKETALLGVSTETLVRRHRSQSAAP